MDRFARFLPLRLVVPLVGVALACLPWVLLHRGGSVPAENAPAAQSALLRSSSPGVPIVRASLSGNPTPAAATAMEPPALLASPSTSKPPAIVAAGPVERDFLSPIAPDPPGMLQTGPNFETPAADELIPPPPPRGAGGREQAAAAGQPPQQFSPPQSFRSPVEPRAERSEQMENLAKQADRQIIHGFELANREAYFAARAEFTAALRLIAQGLDAEHRTTAHSGALSAGLTAMKEAQDFFPTGTRTEADLDLPALVGSHRTPVLKNAPAGELRPMSATKSYLTFAQEQLAAAAGREVSGSMALYAMGKLHATLARQKTLEVRAAEPKAVAFLQAALLAYPNNAMASNELGVLMAHCESYAAARSALEHSASIYPAPENLTNLAIVYQQMGEQRLAGVTYQRAEMARRAEAVRMKGSQNSAGGLVQWVSPQALAQSGGQSAGASPASAPPGATDNNGSGSPAKRPILGWLPGAGPERQ